MKIAVITSVFGNVQQLRTPNTKWEGVDYYAYVDREFPCEVWNQIVSPDFTIDKKFTGRRNAKIYKIMPHVFLPDYDYHIWMDPTHDIISDPKEFCPTYLKDNDIALFKHPERSCIYDEANTLIELTKGPGGDYDVLDNIYRQLEFYEEEGFPKDFGLFELSASIRKNTPQIQAMNLRWWEIICRFSSRDQISLPFVLNSLNIDVKVLPGFANNGLRQNPIIPQLYYKGF